MEFGWSDEQIAGAQMVLRAEKIYTTADDLSDDEMIQRESAASDYVEKMDEEDGLGGADLLSGK